MKLVIVAEVIGRDALHRYGHPLKVTKAEELIDNRGRYIINRWKSLPNKDITQYKAIYSANKYRLLTNRKCDVVSSRLMVVDDNLENVYKYCSIVGGTITIDKFNETFKELGLKLKTNITKKEDRDAVTMIFEYNKIDTLSNLFEYFGGVSEFVYDHFLLNHFDLLMERYLDYSKIRKMPSLAWSAANNGLLLKYIENSKKFSNTAIVNIINMLYVIIFKERLNILRMYQSVFKKFKRQLIDEKEDDSYSIRVINTILNFINEYIDIEFLDYDYEVCRVEDFFIAAYYLFGKPEIDNIENFKNVRITAHSILCIGEDPFKSAISFIPKTRYSNPDFFKKMSAEELYALFSHSSFEPFESHSFDTDSGRKNSTKLHWLPKDEETLKMYNDLLALKDKKLSNILTRRYRVPNSSYTLCALNCMSSFSNMMFFIYMNPNYNSFMKDIELLDCMFNHSISENVLTQLDCSKFVNDKIKHEFISILLIRLESTNTKNDLIKVFKQIKRRKDRIDPEIIDRIKNSDYSKLKGALICNKL